MNEHQKAIRLALVRANALKVRSETARDDVPRWADGTPKRQRPDGKWETDWATLVAEKFDRSRIDAEESYARKVFRELGDGDAALGERRFQAVLEAEHEAAKPKPHVLAAEDVGRLQGEIDRALLTEQRDEIDAKLAELPAAE